MTLGTPVATAPAAPIAPASPVRWTASWPPLAAWGAGLILLALGAGALTGAQPRGLSLISGASLVVLGASALAWGALSLARGRVVTPRAALAGVLTGMVAAAVAIASDPERVSIIATSAALALLVIVGIACGLTVRRGSAPTARYGVWGLLVGAFLVAGLVTPALGATEAGRNAPDHSSHELVFDQQHHH